MRQHRLLSALGLLLLLCLLLATEATTPTPQPQSLAPSAWVSPPGSVEAGPPSQPESTWSIETVDSPHYFYGMGERSLALDGAGHPHISYRDENLSYLKYAYHDGSAWHLEYPGGGIPGSSTSLALDGAGLPHIAYMGDYRLEYARYDGSVSQVEVVDATPSAGAATSLVLGPDQLPRIACQVYDPGDLKYAAPGACDPVAGLAMAWEPITPTAGQLVTLTATATGTAPITFTWDLGDGGHATGALITHSYDLSGQYLLVVTATNSCGQAVLNAPLWVEPPVWRIFLPLVYRSGGG